MFSKAVTQSALIECWGSAIIHVTFLGGRGSANDQDDSWMNPVGILSTDLISSGRLFKVGS